MLATDKICLILGLCILIVSHKLWAQTENPQGVRPNILLIVSDDQGYHDVSYYGTSDLQTPHIDTIANSGMRLDNFYANSPVCSPTRASLLTGLYPDQVGVPGVIRTHGDNSWGFLSPDLPLLPTALKKAGYETALIGKWHLGLASPNTPNERGFDYFKGWLGDMMDDYWKHLRHGINYMRENEKAIQVDGHATDLFSDWSVEYIKQQADKKAPFFLYLAYNAPHFPVQPPEDWLKNVQLRESGISDIRARLVAFIEHMDSGIGKVVQTLKETGQYDNTIIIFTSDNGGHLPSLANNGPLRDGKQSMYEGGLKVPACISWPGHIKAGSISERKLMTLDLYPTLQEVAGIEPELSLVGKSFLSTLLGKEIGKEKDRPMYFVRREGGETYGGKCIYALRYGDWKLVQNSPYQPMELYNLKEDPLEEHNLKEQYREQYTLLNGMLMRHIQEGGRVPWQQLPTVPPQE